MKPPTKTTRSNTSRYRRLLTATLFGLSAAILSSPTVAGSTILVYQAKDGSRLITDQVQVNSNYKLIKTYRAGSTKLESVSYSPPTFNQPRPKASRFDGLIDQTAIKYGIDKALIKAMVQVESGYNPNAVSKKGAYGLMQLMPDTAKRYGVRNLRSPTDNLQGGVRYLKDLLQMFDHDTRLALAAYNAGENSVKRYNGIPPYRETINYVKKVMQLHQVYALR